ncbi:MAG TPA: DUF2269 family protein [Baekduia sp.]|uniref:DUF2269 family protein n=1 Tax=Baekduia sp. TaxID=2600305 RepID=UPI002D777043|nr:DUF2269 family protein [Baekduia sp.]HET6509446.1 DUF2269 family protein [Baekduia sp.]
MLAITFYGVVLAVHIMAVVVAFGFAFAFPAFMPWARRTHPEAMPVIHELTGRLGRFVMAPAMVLVLAAGVYLASKADVWSETWVSVPLLILIVIGALSGMVFAPSDRKLAELARRDLAAGGELSAEYDALFRRVAFFGLILIALVLIAIFFMAAKP